MTPGVSAGMFTANLCTAAARLAVDADHTFEHDDRVLEVGPPRESGWGAALDPGRGMPLRKPRSLRTLHPIRSVGRSHMRHTIRTAHPIILSRVCRLEAKLYGRTTSAFSRLSPNVCRSSPRRAVSRWNLGEPIFAYAPPAAFTGTGASSGDSARLTSLEWDGRVSFQVTAQSPAPHICLSVRGPVCHFVLPRANDDADWPSDSLPPQSEG
jgi:hypothetical protein